MEGLSKLIKDMHHRGRLSGIKLLEDSTITHLLFVDDVLMFLNGGIGDLTTIQNTINIFKTATGMTIKNSKSIITVSKCSPTEIKFSIQRFPFSLNQIDGGLRYLGYRLKPLGYKIADWIWLITKLEERLNMWYHKHLSRAGRLVLIKLILEATPVY